MDSVEFIIPGRISGKARPRFTKKGVVYTLARTASDESVVRHFASQAMRGRKLLEGPLSLTIEINIKTPASWSKKRKAAAFHVVGRPDLDNVIKLIGDALNGIVWRDDSQISHIDIARYYNAPERISVCVGVRALP